MLNMQKAEGTESGNKLRLAPVTLKLEVETINQIRSTIFGLVFNNMKIISKSFKLPINF